MGLNAEMVKILVDLRPRFAPGRLSVIELGAQDLCAAPEVVDHVLGRAGLAAADTPTGTARELYRRLGFAEYDCIDATDLHGALIFDLNTHIPSTYGFNRQFDLVTNLGTAEHCFNQFEVFRNMHDICKVGGYIIHACPAAGNVNHGFFNYHPRFFADLAAANQYELIKIAFTVDYQPELIEYSISNYRKCDNRDILLYVVLHKTHAEPFRVPFDGMFAQNNVLESYSNATSDPLTTAFAPYLKGGDWSGTRGHAVLPWWRRGRVRSLLSRLRLR